MSRYHNQRGFIFLIVLMFMQIFILLNWYALEDIELLSKFIKNVAAHDLLDQEAYKILSGIETAVVSELPKCVISVTDPDQLIEKPLNFWQTQTCSGNFQILQYYYVLEPLTTDACAIVEQTNKPAVYFRITLFVRSHTDDTRLFLQSTLIRPSTARLQPCKGVLHSVQMGRQSWQELNYY